VTKSTCPVEKPKINLESGTGLDLLSHPAFSEYPPKERKRR
jgi:hypothetical protein